jgi:galacturonosyltransferase
MKHVLMLVNDSTYAFNLRREVIEAMLEQGWFVSIACEKKQHFDELQNMGCTLISLPIRRRSKNPFSNLKLFKNYKRLLKQEHPDVVLTYNIKPNIYGGMVCAHRGIPYLVNVCGLGTPVEYPGPLQMLTVMLYRLALKKASCVFFQNTDNEQFFDERNMAPVHHHLLPGSGVNIQYYQVLDYPQNKTIDFFFISRVMKEKGVNEYLEAAKVIHEKYPEAIFHILGSCDDDSVLECIKTAEMDGYIKYHGQQSRVLPFQKINSCTVHPSYYPEGMSNVLLESAACGRPIITTNRSGCREIIDDGVNGYICKQQDSADLIRQIEKFLALTWEQRHNMGIKGRIKVEQEFDRKIVVRAYLDEIKNLDMQKCL